MLISIVRRSHKASFCRGWHQVKCSDRHQSVIPSAMVDYRHRSSKMALIVFNRRKRMTNFITSKENICQPLKTMYRRSAATRAKAVFWRKRVVIKLIFNSLFVGWEPDAENGVNQKVLTESLPWIVHLIAKVLSSPNAKVNFINLYRNQKHYKSLIGWFGKESLSLSKNSTVVGSSTVKFSIKPEALNVSNSRLMC